MKKFLLILLAMSLLTACANTPAPVKLTLQTTTMKFEPATLEVTAGQPVELTFQNDDVLDHDFSIMEIPIMNMSSASEPMAGHDMGNMSGEPDLHIAVAVGKSSVLKFTPTKPGTYEFYCTVAGHKEAGMVGTLVVKAP